MELLKAQKIIVFSVAAVITFSMTNSLAEDDRYDKECDFDNNGKMNGYPEVKCRNNNIREQDLREIEAIERRTEANRRETEANRRDEVDPMSRTVFPRI
ncbi:hypothetical protein [Thiorhodovibrio frisius]|uniref:Uncharacterized protein n=1 Tax=Thiorhodovibrio frisius TaxID=631362 RepID=H8Z8S6_9GAMM|nr:hypothetical protein [Thiorhodovibrio frisius]EIC19481.1 hypothetical protein Thi970DRAFT_05007 [Thiorhodovibrio frisius]WPL22370.1 hypothetical protein Thiofri_02532 [Thiorhodovibrio frisius]